MYQNAAHEETKVYWCSEILSDSHRLAGNTILNFNAKPFIKEMVSYSSPDTTLILIFVAMYHQNKTNARK